MKARKTRENVSSDGAQREGWPAPLRKMTVPWLCDGYMKMG